MIVHNDSHYVETLKLDPVFTACKNKLQSVSQEARNLNKSTGSRDEMLDAEPCQAPAPSRGGLSLFWRTWEGAERCRGGGDSTWMGGNPT